MRFAIKVNHWSYEDVSSAEVNSATVSKDKFGGRKLDAADALERIALAIRFSVAAKTWNYFKISEKVLMPTFFYVEVGTVLQNNVSYITAYQCE